MADPHPTNPREQRLAAQLRENLKRRKAQARAQQRPAAEDVRQPITDTDGAPS